MTVNSCDIRNDLSYSIGCSKTPRRGWSRPRHDTEEVSFDARRDYHKGRLTVGKNVPAERCECGCGRRANPGSRFIKGHSNLLRKKRRLEATVDHATGEITLTLHCPKCQTDKPLDAFPRKGNYRDGTKRYGYCRPCHSVYQRRQKLKRVFNISVEEYDAMLDAQGGVCAICERPPGKTRLAIDHEHKTGLIRGLVCPPCNHGLGYWADDIRRLDAAAQYLRTPPAVAALGAPRFGRKGKAPGGTNGGSPYPR